MAAGRQRSSTQSLLVCILSISLVLTGGCVSGLFGPPEPQDRPVYVNLINEHNTSQTFELWVGEGAELEGIQVNRATGGDHNTTEGRAGISNHHPGDYHTVLSLSFPDDVRLYGRYTLAPNGSRDWYMPEPFGQTVFVVVIYNEDRVTTWISVSCDRDVLYGFSVEATYYGGSGGYSCL